MREQIFRKSGSKPQALRNKLRTTGAKMRDSVKRNFVYATLNFLFIFAYIQVFQLAFGAQNTVIAIITTILMGICAAKDVSRTPLKSFFVQTFVFAGMATAACFSVALGPRIAIPINFVTVFLILYAYTYEYAGHLYFPYILSYLFLIFISPVPPAQLPMRLLSVAVSCACMVLYALTLCYRNIRKPARKAVDALLGEAIACARSLRDKKPLPDNVSAARALVRKLSDLTKNRRKGILDIPETAIAVFDAGRGTEYLIALLHDPCRTECETDAPWDALIASLSDCRRYLNGRGEELPLPGAAAYAADDNLRIVGETLQYIRASLLACRPKRAKKPRSTAGEARGETESAATSEAKAERVRLPFGVRLKSRIGYSPVRLVYAIRVTLLLTLFLIPVQYLHLAHGKWLLFTLASVSLPYAEDVAPKAAKRALATVLGGAAAVVLYSLLDDPFARTAVMMLSGYLSFYFAGYVGNYACATVGALGGAATDVTGWSGVATIYGIRLAYIVLGCVIALLANVLICPYRRKEASERLFRKYDESARLLTELSPELLRDRRLYYLVVIENNLLEEKLLCNASQAHTDIEDMTRTYRACIRRAHHNRFSKTG